LNLKTVIALRLVENGLKVFPTKNKVPNIYEYGINASSNKEQVKGWFADDNDLEIGVLLSDGDYHIIDLSTPYLTGEFADNIKTLKEDDLFYCFMRYNLETYLSRNGGFIPFKRIPHEEEPSREMMDSDQKSTYIEQAEPKLFLNKLFVLSEEKLSGDFTFEVDCFNGVCSIDVELGLAGSEDDQFVYYSAYETEKKFGSNDFAVFSNNTKAIFTMNFSAPDLANSLYTYKERKRQLRNIQKVLTKGKGKLLEVRATYYQISGEYGEDVEASKTGELLRFDGMLIEDLCHEIEDYFERYHGNDLNVDLGDDYIMITLTETPEVCYEKFGDTRFCKVLLLVPPEKFLR